MTAAPDVLVVGGGIVGAACARALARRGVSVTILEAGPKPGAATHAAAGMLAPMAEALPEDPLLAVSVRARDLYADLAPVLRDETGIDIGLWINGVLQVAFTEEEATAARNAIAWQRQLGFTTDWLSREELRERIPGIAPDALGATLAPEDGALEPLLLLDALLDSAEARGGTMLRGEKAEEVLLEGDRAIGVRTATTRHAGGGIVLAAGCWSGRIGGLPRPVSVEPVRGQMAALPWPAAEPPAIVYGPEGYLVHRRGEALAGTTMEHVGFDPAVTPEGIERIVRSARRLLPGLGSSTVRRRWAGLRPGTPDGRPLLGRDPAVRNLWYATGHGRNGILLAGLTGELLAQLYLGEEVDYDLAPLDPGRFWSDR